jgi:branched-chain amino acid transport system ATP-binding protein
VTVNEGDAGGGRPGGLAAEGISVEFGGLLALDAVSLECAVGEIVGVIGPNGAGKTTLFNVLCGFVRPSSGVITIDGSELRRHQPHDLAKLGVARTLQAVGLLPGLSVLENVMLGAQCKLKSDFASALLGIWRSSREETRFRKRALEVLSELSIEQYARWYPGQLPYGVQKRASLARALVAEPRYLLLDEPASGLSTADMDELGDFLKTLRSRTGVFLVEHHMDLVLATCDRLVVLNFGRVIATGTPGEVSADPEVTRAYLGEDVRRVTDIEGSVPGA